MTIRNHTDLEKLETLEERFAYLQLRGLPGVDTFGFDRWMNQKFYSSREWRQVRSFVIARDLGMELGAEDIPVRGSIYIHHMNPITVSDITDATDNLLDPEFLISCSLNVHNAVHYGDESLLPRPFVERRPGDTRQW